MKISDILKRKRSQKVITIGQEKTIADAVVQLNARGLGALLVVDDDEKVVGIFTERDVIRALNHGSWGDVAAIVVSAVMTRDVECVAPHTETLDALDQMEKRRCRHMPVLDQDVGKVIGVVSIRDLRSAALDHLQFEHEAMKEVLTATGVSVYVPPPE